MNKLDQRRSYRFDKVFPVDVTSSVFGECQAIARNVSSGGIFLEVSDPLPLGAIVRVHFAMPDCDGEIVARGEVKGHYFLNFADHTGPRTMTGMGVRFTAFESDGEESFSRSLGRLTGPRTIH